MPRQQRVWLCMGLLALAAGVFFRGVPAKADGRFAPQISVCFVHSTTFVGETPWVRIAVTAPEEQKIEILKEGALRTYADAIFDLYDPNGRLIPNGRPNIDPAAPRDWPGNFSSLAAGKTRVWIMPVFGWSPQPPGEYVLRLELRPLPDKTWVYKQKLALRVKEIPSEKIVARKVLTTPRYKRGDGEFQRIELLNVPTKRGYKLLFRRARTIESKDYYYTTRVTTLDRDSTISAVPKFFDKLRVENEIWATFDRGGDLFLVRISDTGVKRSEERLTPTPEKKKSP